MNSVLVPNIVITDNPAIAKVFNDINSQYTSFTNYIEDIEKNYDEEDFIYFTSENTEFLNFDFEVGSSKPGGSGYTCSVEFLETGAPFERKLLKSNIQKVISSNGQESYSNRNFYIAFGVGDTLSYWSRFNTCPLYSGEMFQAFNQPKTIKLKFSVASMDNDLDSLLFSSDIDTDSIEKIEFNNTQEEGFLSKLEFTNGKKIKTTSNEKIANYLYGFNSFDYLLKKTITQFLQTVYCQIPNVFFVTKDLKQLLFSKIKPPKVFEYDTISPLSFDVAVKGFVIKDSTEREIAENLTLTQAGGIKAILEGLPGVCQDYLGLSLTIPRDGLDPDIKCFVKFASEQADSDDLTLEAKKDKLRKKIEDLREGLARLGGVETVLIRESDAEIIASFINQIPEETRKLIPLNPNMPMIMFGQKDVIRSLLYGESYDGVEYSNEEIQKFIKKRMIVYNLYGSHHASKKTEEDLIEAEIKIDDLAEDYPDFPIFRYNVKNPNILSLNVEKNNVYAAMLQASFSKPVEYYEGYSLNQENDLIRILLGQKKDLKTETYKDTAPAREELFDLLEIKSKQIVNDKMYWGKTQTLTLLEAQLKKLKKDSQKIFSKLFDDKKFLKFFDFILNLYGADGGTVDLSNLRTMVENKFTKDLDERKGDYTKTKKEQDLNVKITSFLEKEYSISNEDLDSYMFIVYSILALFLEGDSEKSALSTDKKVVFLRYTLKNYDESTITDGLIYSDLYKTVKGYSFTVEIKTLPFFGLSNQYWVGHPCILYAKRPRLIGATYEDVADDFLTGSYRILRMKHEISSSNCESTFVLQKIGSTIGNPNKHDNT